MGIGKKEVASQYPTFEAGIDYQVKFHEFFPTDNDGLPYLVPQSRFGEETLVIRYRTRLENGDEGPVGSIDPKRQLALLVQTFGGDPTELPPFTHQETGQILILAKNLMKGAVTVRVNPSSSDSEVGSWIGFVEGMTVPKGNYLFGWGRVTSFNEEGRPSWVPGQYGPLVYGRLVIVAGKFKGTEVPFFLPYDFLIDEETMEPCFKETEKTGQLTAGSVKLQNMITSFYGDPAEFPHETCEDIYNIVPELVTLFEKGGKIASGQTNDRGAADLKTLAPPAEGLVMEKTVVEPEPKVSAAAESSEPPAKEKAPAPRPTSEPTLEAAQVVLRNVISVETKHQLGEKAVAWEDEKNWVLSADGKKWAGEHLVAIVDDELAADGETVVRQGVGRYFQEYTLEDIKFILEGLGYDIVALFEKRTEEPTVEEAEEDEPPF